MTSRTAITVIEVGRCCITLPHFFETKAQTSVLAGEGNGRSTDGGFGSGPLAGVGEELGFVLALHPLDHLPGDVEPFRIATAVGEAEIVDRGRLTDKGGQHLLDLGPEIVAGGEVEAHRSAAAAALVAIALPERRDPLQILLLAAVLPRVHVAVDDRLAHSRHHKGWDLRRG